MSIDFKKIKKLDKKNLYSSIMELDLQCEQILSDSDDIKIPTSYKNIKNVVISGMGGSILGGHIIKSVFKKELKVPVELISDYNLPDYVGRETLCIMSSYSGTTEEPLTTFEEARKKRAKIFIIASGGKFAELAKKYKIPSYIFNPKHNRCGEPRMGLGYSIFGQIIIFSKIGLINPKRKDLENVIKTVKKFKNKFKLENSNNPALRMAHKMFGKTPIITGSEILLGNIHTFNNQINENAKNFAAWMTIPNINHHLLEGLKYPKSNIKNLFFIFFNSGLYHKRNQLRYKITEKILEKNKISFDEYKATSKTELDQSFEALVFGSFASFYLAMLNNLNPSPVPYVDFLKKEINK